MIQTFSTCAKPAPMIIIEDDVMADILMRLPLKSLLISKCVCRRWNRLISDHVFMSNYTRRSPQHHVSGIFLQKLFFLQLYSELGFITYKGQIDAAQNPSLSFIEDDNGIFIRHSCNGLLLCSSFRCHEEDCKYYICKPTTKQYLPLPKPVCKTVFSINIACDPNISPHYKVICICDSKYSVNHREINIYDSAIGSWRVSGNPWLFSDDLLFHRGVFWNGALHWVGKGDSSLCFDVEQELLLPMPMPPIQDGWTERRLGYFGESGGHLYLIEIYGPQTTIFDVMEMKSDYSGWLVKYHVNLETIAIRCQATVWGNIQDIHRHIFSVLHIVYQEVGDEDESFMVLHIPGDFISYRLKDNTLMGPCNISSQVKTMNKGLGLWCRWEGVYPYTNSCCYL